MIARARKLAAICAALVLHLAPSSAQAAIEILIPDVTRAVETNVRAYLSLTRYADRADVDPEIMSRLQRRIVKETRDALQPLGYYEPQVTYVVEQQPTGWRVTVNVKPGRPVRYSQVALNVKGPGADERAIRAVIAAEAVKSGNRLNHGNYERLKGDLLRTAKNEGYLDAQLTRSELVIDRAARRADVAIELDTGLRYSFGEIRIAQDVIKDESMRRLLRMKPGDPYTLDSLLRSQYVLDDSLYFSTVNIESGEADRAAHTVPITVTAEPNRRHRYATSLGYGTDTGPRGKFSWDNRRVNRSGHRFKVELLGSSVLKEITARYAIPVMDIALEKLEFGAGVSEEELGDTLSQRAEVSAGLTQVLGRWQRVLYLRLLNETSTEANGAADTQFLMIPGVTYSTLPSYIVGGRVRPYFLYGELRGSPQTLGSDKSFLQVRLQGERVFDVAPLWHLRLRAEIGASEVADLTELPASLRFFAGGERSVRGFELNELSPNDEGGKHVATGAVEVTRDLPRNFGVAAFYDIGNAFDDFTDPDLQYSVGVGVRYNVAVISIGADVAQALSESGRNPRLHLYISTQF